METATVATTETVVVAGIETENSMRAPRIHKVTLNVGLGGGGEKMQDAMEIIKGLCGRVPIKTLTDKRIPDFGIRPKMVVGCKLTLRGSEAEDFLKRAFETIDNKISETNFDSSGNFSFGIREHIDMPGVKYDPTKGIIGMDVCVTLERAGFRISRRSLKRKPIPNRHRLTPKVAQSFISEKFNVKIISKEQQKEEESWW